MTTPTEALAEDYTACGVALIGMNLGGGGTARVNVYCELPVNHDGNHAAAIEWEDPPHVVRIAQGSERLSAALLTAAQFAEEIRNAREAAWLEGYSDGRLDEAINSETDNPYAAPVLPAAAATEGDTP